MIHIIISAFIFLLVAVLFLAWRVYRISTAMDKETPRHQAPPPIPTRKHPPEYKTGIWYMGSEKDGLTGIAVCCGFVEEGVGYTTCTQRDAIMCRELLSPAVIHTFNYAMGESLAGYALVFKDRVQEYTSIFSFTGGKRERPVRTWFADGSFDKNEDGRKFLNLYKPCNWGKFPSPQKLRKD